MMKVEVTLTIGAETKKVEAYISTRPYATIAVVNGLKMVTTQGNKQHTGWAEFLVNDENEYDIKNAVDIRYVGMRGNGIAKRSNFRNISF